MGIKHCHKLKIRGTFTLETNRSISDGRGSYHLTTGETDGSGGSQRVMRCSAKEMPRGASLWSGNRGPA